MFKRLLEFTTLSEDWGSSDWYPVMRQMQVYIDQGYSIDDAASLCADSWYQDMGWAEPEQAEMNIVHRYKALKSLKKEEKISEDEQSVDLRGKTHKGCGGKFDETSQMDDMDGVLHCKKCEKKVDRYVSPESLKKLSEGMFVVKNQDGVEKRFKDSNSPEANAWKSTSKKPSTKIVPYSDDYWQDKKDKSEDFDFITLGHQSGMI